MTLTAVILGIEVLALGVGVGLGVGWGTRPAPRIDDPDIDDPVLPSRRISLVYSTLALLLSLAAGAVAYGVTRLPGTKLTDAFALLIPFFTASAIIAIAAGLFGGVIAGWLAQRLLGGVMTWLYRRTGAVLNRIGLSQVVSFGVGFALQALLDMQGGVVAALAGGLEAGLLAMLVAMTLVLRKVVRSKGDAA